MSSILIFCESELEMDLSTQSDWKELKLGVGIEPVWKTRSWPASQEHKFQRSAAIGFWEKSRVRPLSLSLLSSSSRDFFNLWGRSGADVDAVGGFQEAAAARGCLEGGQRRPRPLLGGV